MWHSSTAKWHRSYRKWHRRSCRLDLTRTGLVDPIVFAGTSCNIHNASLPKGIPIAVRYTRTALRSTMKGAILSDPTRHCWYFLRADQAAVAAWLAHAACCPPAFAQNTPPVQATSPQAMSGSLPQHSVRGDPATDPVRSPPGRASRSARLSGVRSELAESA